MSCHTIQAELVAYHFGTESDETRDAVEALRPFVEARQMFRVSLFPSPKNDKRFQGVVDGEYIDAVYAKYK